MSEISLIDEVFKGELENLTISGEKKVWEYCNDCMDYNGRHDKECSNYINLWDEEKEKEIQDESCVKL